jgi:hypothetical protein
MTETLTVDQFHAARGSVRDLRKSSPTGRVNQSQPTPGKMNKTEQLYAYELDLLQRAGKIKLWKFEGLKLRLADRTTYSPDFVVWHLDNSIELVETKGYWQEDAKVKFKVAREAFPCFTFTAIKRNKSGWEPAI